jgi:hypothetical protein
MDVDRVHQPQCSAQRISQLSGLTEGCKGGHGELLENSEAWAKRPADICLFFWSSLIFAIVSQIPTDADI